MSALVPCARFPEEPVAVISHAGICEGGTGKPVSLPQSVKMKRLLRITSYSALAVVMITITVRVLNRIQFAATKPESSQKCNYSGTWMSNRAPLVAGRIVAELPSPLPKGQSFTVKAYIYYNITSLYRTGRFVPMQLEAFIDDTGATSGGNSDHPVVLPPRITFKYKSDGPGGPQTIDYVAASDDQFTQITGGYRSSSPDDIGTFSLEKWP